MEQTEKARETSVHGQRETKTVECDHRDCRVIFDKDYYNQKFCCTPCHDAEHTKRKDDGNRAAKCRGKIFPSMKSPALRKMIAFLSDGEKHDSREIVRATETLDHRSDIAGLRHHGFSIPEAKLTGYTPEGRKIFVYQLIGGARQIDDKWYPGKASNGCSTSKCIHWTAWSETGCKKDIDVWNCKGAT